MQREALIVLGRGRRQWESLVPGLARYGRVVEIKNKRYVCITERNVTWPAARSRSENPYEAIVASLAEPASRAVEPYSVLLRRSA